MATKHNFGILASISWNSNKWQAPSTVEDIDNSNFDWVKKNRTSYDDLTFGHEIYPLEKDGTFLGHTPQLSKAPTREQSKFVEIVFFRSFNYHDRKNYIVGFYAFPEIKNVQRLAEHTLFEKFPAGNVKAKKEHITLFENPVDITIFTGILPVGKEMGRMGFNYLKYDNVLKVLDLASNKNPENSIIKNVKLKFLTDKKYLALR